MGRISGFIWVAALIGATIFAVQAQAVWGDHPLLIPALVVLWVVTLITLIPIPAFAAARKVVAAPVHALRRSPILYWVALLGYVVFMIGWWVVHYQPNNGHYMQPFEFAYLLMVLWGWLYLIRYDGSREEAVAMGGKLSKNPLTGVLITLTTVIFLFSLAEAYLRIFYVTTDAYTYTAMNYWWYQNFYYTSFNSLGYRDYEPTPDAPHRIAVVGDSFTVGQGINNLDDTFAQLLERGLNDGTDVNVVAQSGWDSDVQEYWLNQYPYQPDTVILSYYLNDLDYQLTAERDPNTNFSFPDPGIAQWFVLNFFVPNYVYYNLIQLTSAQRNSSFLDDLVNAHLDPEIWQRQVMQLDSFVAWTERNNARLIVMMWPNPAGIDDSQPALEQVAAYFQSHGVEVIDLSDRMQEYSTRDLIVNSFDTHPSITAHRIAAEALLEVLQADSGT